MSIVLDGTSGITAPNATVSGTVQGSPVRGGLVSGTAVASTSGTSIDFTDIPSWVKRITVMFSGLSTSGTSIPLVRLGDAGGIEDASYLGSVNQGGGSTPSSANYSSGFAFGTSWSAAVTAHGAVTLNLIGSNVWAANVLHGNSSSSGVYYGGGSKTLSDTLTQVRITTVNGTDTFDAGTINIIYEG